MGPEAPTNFSFGGGAATSTMHPVMLVAVIVAALLLLFGPRKYGAGSILLVVFLGSVGQQLYVGGFHFYAMRILILAGLIRLMGAKFTSATPIFGGHYISDMIAGAVVMVISVRATERLYALMLDFKNAARAFWRSRNSSFPSAP